MSRGVMVYWSWRMAPSWDGLLVTNYFMEGACVHHHFSSPGPDEPRTTESCRRAGRGTPVVGESHAGTDLIAEPQPLLLVAVDLVLPPRGHVLQAEQVVVLAGQ